MPALMVIGLPSNLWLLSLIAIVLGALFLAWSYSFQKKGSHLRADITRDIGIACIVAVVVTGIYELHVREILETEKLEDVLGTVLQYNTPKNVWDEVNKTILKRDVIRRNVEIEFEVTSDNSPAPGLAFLSVKYSYDLYRLKSNSANFPIEHSIVLDYKDLSGFDYLAITDFQGKVLKEYKWNGQGTRLKTLFEEVHLEPAYDFKEDTFDDRNALHVVNERTEIMNVPGTYILGIPELMEGTSERPITVSVHIPSKLNIEPVIDTQWREHVFKPHGEQNGRHLWTYTGILLPGQFFDVRINQLVTSASATTDQ